MAHHPSPPGQGRPPSQRDSKVCVVCGRPFTWRKKWERDWEHVKYCSDRCRAASKKGDA
ncbi:hypothetical protein HNQ07_000153 [Deinococcus metalli]|uniref:DUF2256 domain-containing protein n=1 Tax=Deinococcus metalli TaxID=1141878 RepID=A0A7W8KAJ3_9DEIO|nr:DUF2256 domain-containing protein [Deinococcus metalli]MBB5374709.1 hypothetical protein [Deinococcus metalli]GHF34292.1 hypothetical protein GCM10017781_08900 [Deinococcus metalli]